MTESEELTQVWLLVYKKLKIEERDLASRQQRIVYATLTITTALTVLAAFNVNNWYSFLLLIPWASLILGWHYLANRSHMREIAYRIDCANAESILGWKIFPVTEKDQAKLLRQSYRRRTEILLYFVILFIVPGVVAVVSFWVLAPNAIWILHLLGGLEVLALFVLGLEFKVSI